MNFFGDGGGGFFGLAPLNQTIEDASTFNLLDQLHSADIGKIDFKVYSIYLKNNQSSKDSSHIKFGGWD